MKKFIKNLKMEKKLVTFIDYVMTKALYLLLEKLQEVIFLVVLIWLNGKKKYKIPDPHAFVFSLNQKNILKQNMKNFL